MPEIRFYATKEDLTLVFETMRSELGLIAYEMVSEPGEPLRWFQNMAELSSHFRYCSKQCDFVWWDAESMPPNRPKKQKLDPEKCNGHTFRYAAEFAMIQIETGLKRSRMLTPSELGLVTQAHYRFVGGRAKIDWRRLNGKFKLLRKFIERSSVGKVDGCLVMPSAYELVCEGGHLTESIREGFDRFGEKSIKLIGRKTGSETLSKETAVRHDAKWTITDGWLLMAVYGAAGESTKFVGLEWIIASADMIQHEIPSHDELKLSLSKLVSHGVVECRGAEFRIAKIHVNSLAQAWSRRGGLSAGPEKGLRWLKNTATNRSTGTKLVVTQGQYSKAVKGYLKLHEELGHDS